MNSIIQFLLYTLLHIPFVFLLCGKTTYPKDISLRLTKPVLLTVNHPSRLDPFLLIILPFRLAKRLIPIHFLVAEHYYKKPWLKPLLKLCGAYPLQKSSWALEEFFTGTIERLTHNSNVLIFPEGRISPEPEPTAPKPGSGFVALQTKTNILPIHIKGASHIHLSEIFSRKRHITVSVGMPYRLSDREFSCASTDPLEVYAQATEAIMQRIRAL